MVPFLNWFINETCLLKYLRVLESQQEKCIPELVFGQRLKARTLLVGCWRTLKSASSIFASVVELVSLFAY